MVDYDSQTPMMKQLLDIKKKHPDSILMTRMEAQAGASGRDTVPCD